MITPVLAPVHLLVLMIVPILALEPVLVIVLTPVLEPAKPLVPMTVPLGAKEIVQVAVILPAIQHAVIPVIPHAIIIALTFVLLQQNTVIRKYITKPIMQSKKLLRCS